MPIKSCTDKGKSGKKWGDSGKCYTGKGAGKKASKQASAAYASGYQKESIEEEIANYFHNESEDFAQSEVDDYLTRNDDEEEGMFDDVSTEDLLDPDSPAPWNNI